jgi:hypothetical protein
MEIKDKCRHCAAHRTEDGDSYCDYLEICLSDIQEDDNDDDKYPPCIK